MIVISIIFLLFIEFKSILSQSCSDFNGIGSDGICCNSDCNQCGGSGCSSGLGANNCCTGRILSNFKLCTKTGNNAPCVLPSRYCEALGGIHLNGVCYDEECDNNLCNSDDENHNNNCCISKIIENNELCGKNSKNAPCVLATKYCENIRGIFADGVCCHRNCGTCGGSGCSTRSGGADDCCSGRIREGSRLCNTGGKLAPCVAHSLTDDGLAHFFSPILKFDQAADTFPMDAQIYYNYVIKGEKTTNLLNYVCLRDNRCENKDKNLANIITYYQVFRCESQVRIVYYWWYGYQPQCDFGEGSHEGDWERIVVILSQDLRRVAAVVYYQHAGRLTKTFRTGGFEVENGKPVVYVGKKAHGSYPNGDREESINECQYYGDFRNPSSTSIWNTENNLIDLSKKEQEWMNDRDFYSGIGTKPQRINPENAYCDLETCKGSNVLGADTAGCIQSDCLPGFKRDFEGSKCAENCNSDCDCALWCCPRVAVLGCITCGAAPACRKRTITGKEWTIPHNDQYLL